MSLESAPCSVQADISRIVRFAPAELIGRGEEMALLNDAWDKAVRGEQGRARVLTLVGLGGEGKTSLVAKWVAELSEQGWLGCEAAFAWSFYSQGAREQMAASSDLFLKTALDFFGDEEDKNFAAGSAGPYEKGQRLARVVGRRRCLLILDGVEPLQFAPSSPTAGLLKDQGLAALLKGLATQSQSLCVVTTRFSLPDLQGFWQKAAREIPLQRLSREAGVDLLKRLGVVGSERQGAIRRSESPSASKALPNPRLAPSGSLNEFEQLVEDVHGHALTLTIMGSYLKRAYRGDIRQRDRVRFEKADEKIDGGHALRTIEAYELWLLADGGDEGRREVAVLRLLGLFDRPADAACLKVLRQAPAIAGLTEPLVDLPDEDWEFCLTVLESARLVTINRDESGALISLDAHPHLREYFAKALREAPASEPVHSHSVETLSPAHRAGNADAAWREGHRRLYDHLFATTEDKLKPTLDDLQPLYQAVVHGCAAGLLQQTCDDVYIARIIRRWEQYSFRKLGAFGSDLAAITNFFNQPWRDVSPAVTKADQAWLLNEAAFCLRGLGRLTEAVEPMQTGLEIVAKNEDWEGAAACASNLSELLLTLGEVSKAVASAEQSVTYADRSGDAFERLSKRTTYADALHQAGRRVEALARFREAEQMQAVRQPEYPLLYSLQGFQYCDLLLVPAEQTAWQIVVDCSLKESSDEFFCRVKCDIPTRHAVAQRAVLMLVWEEGMRGAPILDFALHHLTLGRVMLYQSILERGSGNLSLNEGNHQMLEAASKEIDRAVSGLRRAGQQVMLPLGLLTRSWLRYLTGARVGLDSAQADLDEAWEIASRGPMRLFMADVLLTRARLFGEPLTPGPSPRTRGEGRERDDVYPWESAQADLAAAEKLINECGYHRRDEELADAKRALLGTPS